MPHYHKNKSNSKNSSRSSNASSQGSTTSSKIMNDDDFGSIIKKKTSANSTPKRVESPSVEREATTPPPLFTPPPSPWEVLNMTEEDYNAMVERVQAQYREDMKKSYQDFLLAEWDSPSYWSRRLEGLEKEREYFNKKRAWSAMDCKAVEQIDANIKECEDQLDRIESEVDRLEYMYD